MSERPLTSTDTFIGRYTVGTVVGAGAGVGIVAGLVVSGGLDWGSDGAKQAIEGGFDAVGHGIGDAGSAIGDGAKNAWNAIF